MDKRQLLATTIAAAAVVAAGAAAVGVNTTLLGGHEGVGKLSPLQETVATVASTRPTATSASSPTITVVVTIPSGTASSPNPPITANAFPVTAVSAPVVAAQPATHDDQASERSDDHGTEQESSHDDD